MSYLVLARKYRPRKFAEMVGQQHVVQALTGALRTQRLHHAYLFTGTRGVGKTTVSRILAKSLNCVGPDGQGGVTDEPCGVCQACTDIDAGRFVDYVELDAASNRGVDEISQLLDQAVYKPVVGRFKVYMIDEVHMLSTTAFNAMLKTLEEPPEYLKFVLATTDPQKVPVTVLSRCLQFSLRPMAPETVAEHLAQVLATEGVTAEPAAVKALSRAARGSMRDALSLTDQAIAYGSGGVALEAVRAMLGTVGREQVLAAIRALGAGDGAAVVQLANSLRDQGLSAQGFLEQLAVALQRLAVFQAVPGAADAADADDAELAALTNALDPAETQLLYSLALKGREELGLAPDEYSGLTMVLLRLLAFRPADAAPAKPRAMPLKAPSAVARLSRPVPATLSSRPVPAPDTLRPVPAAPSNKSVTAPATDQPVAAPMPTPTAAPAPSAQAGPAAAAPVPAVLPTDAALADRWEAMVRDMSAKGQIAALTKELAAQSQWVVEGLDVWTLAVEREAGTYGAALVKLQAVVSEREGRSITLQLAVQPAPDSPLKRHQAREAAKQRAAEEAIANAPLVRALQEQFGGRVVPGSVRPVAPRPT
jgi:DNA polymerase-3 subunit gamma/tau